MRFLKAYIVCDCLPGAAMRIETNESAAAAITGCSYVFSVGWQVVMSGNGEQISVRRRYNDTHDA